MMHRWLLSLDIREALLKNEPKQLANIFLTHSNHTLHEVVYQPGTNIILEEKYEKLFPDYGKFAHALRTEYDGMHKTATKGSMATISSMVTGLASYEMWPEGGGETLRAFIECAVNPNDPAACPSPVQDDSAVMQVGTSVLLAIVAAGLGTKARNLFHESARRKKSFEAVRYSPSTTPF